MTTILVRKKVDISVSWVTGNVAAFSLMDLLALICYILAIFHFSLKLTEYTGKKENMRQSRELNNILCNDKERFCVWLN